MFASRRQHTRWPRDWSSDVCSYDLKKQKLLSKGKDFNTSDFEKIVKYKMSIKQAKFLYEKTPRYGSEQLKVIWRSEERRVGKECKTGGEHDESKEWQQSTIMLNL